MEKRKLTITLDIDFYRKLNVHAAKKDLKVTELVVNILEDFEKNSIQNDNPSVS
jgi:predicted DNA-binding ribbon-helix-helix protein